MMTTHHAPFAAGLLLLLASACTGSIGEAGGGSANRTDPGGGSVRPGDSTVRPTVAGCDARQAGGSPVRRLTNVEYDNTVRDLLGNSVSVSDDFPQAQRFGSSFSNDATSLTVAPLMAESYMTAAELLAANAAKNASSLLGCNPTGTGEDACIRQFIERFGKRAYRRPLAPDEVTDLFGLYKSIRTVRDATRSVEVTLRAMLQSPHFLYRVELGNTSAAAAVPLTPYEIASRLSYAFWGSMPDDALFAAADADQLKTGEQIVQQARRLWASPRSKPVMEQFYVEWLDLDSLPSTDKDAKAYPDFGALKDAMGRETLAFVNYVLRDGDGRLDTLLTAPVTFANGALAKLYGVPGVAGTDLTRVDLDPSRRAGVLTQLSLLSVTAHTDLNAPIYRGKMIREKFLCQTLPSPPADVPPLPERDPNATVREQLAQHRSAAICNACHTLMDPIGFGFDSYDGMGAWRTMVGQFPVDNEGELTETRDIDGAFHGAPELARKLAGSDEARECMTAMSFRYMFGRATSSDDACSVGVANKIFASSNYDLRELLMALVQTDAFQYRTAGGAQ